MLARIHVMQHPACMGGNLRDGSGDREKVDGVEARRAQPLHHAAASWQM
jgi:hypothetical protein